MLMTSLCERFPESKKELDASLSNESLATVPFLISGNKIDIPYAASEDELCYHLGLDGITTEVNGGKRVKPAGVECGGWRPRDSFKTLTF